MEEDNDELVGYVRQTCLSAVFVTWLNSSLLGLPGIAVLINEFVDPLPLWSFEAAITRGYARLVARLFARGGDAAPDPHIFDELCNRRIDIAARDGDLGTLVDFARVFPSLIITKASAVAAAHRHLHILEWLYVNAGSVCWGVEVYSRAADHGHIAVLEWIDARFPIPVDDNLLNVVIEEGQDMVARWLWVLAIQRDWPVAILQEAMSSASLELARWMYDLTSPALPPSLDFAAFRGEIPFLSWGLTVCTTLTPFAMDSAAANGNLPVLEWLHRSTTAGCTTDAMDNAARLGRIDVLEWLRILRPEGCTGRAFVLAACGGHLLGLQWLVRHYPTRYDPAAFDHAAGSGHLVILNWLSPLTTATTNAMDWAAAGGHLDIIVWLHSNPHRQEGCTVNAIDNAAANGHLEVVVWLHENRREGFTARAMDNAALGGHFEVLVWLHRHNGLATSAAMDGAAAKGFIQIVLWLHSNRVEGCTTAAMDAASAHGDMEMIQWLHTNRAEGCTPEAMANAALAGNTDLLQFFRRNRAEGCSEVAFRWATITGNLHVAIWLASFYPALFNLRDVRSAAERHGRTIQILRTAFGDLVLLP